ncbi:zinc finger protein 181-like isoform X8 [Leptidea sinapis]|uniref:zinc finger protein 181-like isoform X7 n=1 Tax=Leptidea sinapis TaxID=189913 RepID=UPI0021C3CD55|nr:zinc finger protein 181-like isoform X7 [Leptidea sinapis]XP_050676685.1 zinc finger protein 181-like isoform X8 [Leptidea sinapis]
MESNFSDSMCRCCASEGVFKDFNSTYQWMGAEEVYADMLKDCFDITLTVSETINSGGICEVCITQLRNAFNFKKQVQYTEEQFKRKIEEMKFKTEIVKVEEAGEDDFPSDHNLSDDDFSSPEYDIPIIKMESSSESAKSKKRATKGATTRSKKAKTEDGETSAKRNRSKVKKDACKDTEVHAIEDFVTVPQKKNTQNRELYKHIYNVEQVLKWSNATAFKSFGRIGYTCCYCGMEFPDPAVLKKHNLDLHSDGVKTASFAQRRDLCAFNVKLDITDLRCKICEVAIDNIDNLLIHLRSAHQLKLYTEILNHMIPFKFDGDILSCFICQNKFNRFKNLLEHMSVHCRNFICETCDAGFVNKRRLLCHSNQHKLGEFKCSLCVKVFNTLQKKQSHEKNVHLTKGYLNRCGYCNEVFKSYRQKERHLVRVHEYKYTALKCDTCNKQFTHQKAYYIHITRDHLMQRNHECNFCEMKFYSWSELKDHSVKHTKVREFQCDVCLKSFGRRDALKQHLRIHANDRRYKCVRCDQTFIQKCSWRSHMKTKHGETV